MENCLNSGICGRTSKETFFNKGSRKVVVLGGGNTAMDAASESARMGATRDTRLQENKGNGRL